MAGDRGVLTLRADTDASTALQLYRLPFFHLLSQAQLLAFFADANSIFIGEKLLTTPNLAPVLDRAMLTEIEA